MLTLVKHEVELGVVIGKKCRNVSAAEAADYIGGYCLGLDLSAFCELVRFYMDFSGLQGFSHFFFLFGSIFLLFFFNIQVFWRISFLI